MSKISSNEVLNFAWKRHCEGFGISTQAEMYEWSHLNNLVTAVKSVVENEKNKILFAKPLNAILAAGNKIKSDNEHELTMTTSKIELLTMPDADIDEKEENLTKANRRLSKKINSLGEDLDSDIQNLVRKGKNELEDIVDNSCRRLLDIVHNEWRRLKSFDSVRPRLETELQNLYMRKLKRATESLAEEGKRKIKRSVGDFFADAEDLLMRYLPDFDSRDFVKSTQNKIHMEMETSDLFSYDSDNEESQGLGDFIWSFLNGASFGVLEIAGNLLSHGSIVARVEDNINSISRNFDPEPYLEHAFQRKEEVINSVRESFITGLIEPLQEQIQEIRTKKDDKEKELQNAETKKKELEDRKDTIAQQLESISEMKQSLL